MKKYFSANFMLEVIIPENEEPDYILRDQNGKICTVGKMSDVETFLTFMYDQFKQANEKDHEGEY